MVKPELQGTFHIILQFPIIKIKENATLHEGESGKWPTEENHHNGLYSYDLNNKKHKKNPYRNKSETLQDQP